MSRKVLVTLDGSIFAEAILPVLVEVLRPGDNLTFFSVAHTEPAVRRERLEPQQAAVVGSSVSFVNPAPLYAESKDQVIQREGDDLLDYLNSKAAPFRRHGVEVSVKAMVSDRPGEAIVEFARELGASLVAMATHGRSGLNEMIHGSVAAEVIKSGVAPVLLVRP